MAFSMDLFFLFCYRSILLLNKSPDSNYWFRGLFIPANIQLQQSLAIIQKYVDEIVSIIIFL